MKFRSIKTKAELSFYQLPKIFMLPTSKYFNMSLTAKTIYAILEDRDRLSIRNGWIDELGNIYFLYNQKKICEVTGIKDAKTLRKYLKELESMGLLYRESMGKGLADRYYLLEVDVTEEEAHKIFNDEEEEFNETNLNKSKKQENSMLQEGEEKFPKGGKENFPKGLGKFSPRNKNEYNNNKYNNNNNNNSFYSNNNINNKSDKKTYCNLEKKEVIEQKIDDIMDYTAYSYNKYQCKEFLNTAKGDVDLFKYAYDKVLASMETEKDKTIKSLVGYIIGTIKKESKKFYNLHDDNI